MEKIIITTCGIIILVAWLVLLSYVRRGYDAEKEKASILSDLFIEFELNFVKITGRKLTEGEEGLYKKLIKDTYRDGRISDTNNLINSILLEQLKLKNKEG